ncbi:hypothetical protein [Borrelia duttonii]|uniref:hypothetical protein n=1 Tax=Borrelia duttonii TaxID=40834 RepID=UPI0002E5FBC8
MVNRIKYSETAGTNAIEYVTSQTKAINNSKLINYVMLTLLSVNREGGVIFVNYMLFD